MPFTIRLKCCAYTVCISHSFVFAILGGAALTGLLKLMGWWQAVSIKRLFVFHFLCLVTHMLLDYCTAYGTQLLLPFSDARLGLDCVNVVDPVYTLPLLVFTLGGMLIPAWKKSKFKLNRIGLIVSTLYILITLLIKSEISTRLTEDLQAQNIQPTQQMTMPVGMASLHWYGVAKADNGIYMKRYSLFEGAPNALTYFPANNALLQQVEPDWAETMQWFSKGYYTLEAKGDTVIFYNLQVDMRGMVLDRTPPAPTQGYFEYAPNGKAAFHFGSGALD